MKQRITTEATPGFFKSCRGSSYQPHKMSAWQHGYQALEHADLSAQSSRGTSYQPHKMTAWQHGYQVLEHADPSAQRGWSWHPTPLGWPLGERDNKQTQNSSRGQTVSSRRPGSCLPFHSSMPGAQYSAWHRVSCQERFVERRNKGLVALNHKDKRKMKNAHRMGQQNSGKLLMAAYWREQES